MYLSVRISEVDAARQRLIQCIKDICNWCASRQLQLNAPKTELVWFAMHASLQKMSSLDLSLMVDDDTRTCFFHLCRCHQIRCTVGREVTQRIVSPVLCWFTRGNQPFDRSGSSRIQQHVSSLEFQALNTSLQLLQQLHWLPVLSSTNWVY